MCWKEICYLLIFRNYLFVFHQHDFVIKICDLISKERFSKFLEIFGRWAMWHMFLKIVFLNFSDKIDNIISLFFYSFIANRSFKLFAFFFNADLRIMGFLKVFLTKGLLFSLITFDFNAACLFNTLRNWFSHSV